MKVDLDALEATAKAATPGPWRFGDWSATFGTLEQPERMLVLERNLTHAGAEPYVCGRRDGRYQVLHLEELPDRRENTAHIAANSPDVTLALVARIRELEAALGEACELSDVAERCQDDGWYERRAALDVVLEKGTTR